MALSESAHNVGASGSILVSYMLHFWGYVPSIVAICGGTLGIIWYLIMIWESETVRKWRHARAARLKLHKIAKLEAKTKVVRAQLDALELKRAAAIKANELVRTAEVIASENIATAAAEAKTIQLTKETAAAVTEIKKG